MLIPAEGGATEPPHKGELSSEVPKESGRKMRKFVMILIGHREIGLRYIVSGLIVGP